MKKYKQVLKEKANFFTDNWIQHDNHHQLGYIKSPRKKSKKITLSSWTTIKKMPQKFERITGRGLQP